MIGFGSSEFIIGCEHLNDGLCIDWSADGFDGGVIESESDFADVIWKPCGDELVFFTIDELELQFIDDFAIDGFGFESEC